MLPTVRPRLRVLGVDPGTRLLGWGVVEGGGGSFTALAHGVVRASPDAPIAERLRALATGLREVVLAHRPAEAALEEVFYGKDVHAAVRIGEGRGVALLVLAEAGVPVTGYANNVVKKAVAGAGRADKERVLAMLRRVLGLTERPETLDASDALALALCHHQRRPGLVTSEPRSALAGGAGGGAAALRSAARGSTGPSPRLREAIRRARGGTRPIHL